LPVLVKTSVNPKHLVSMNLTQRTPLMAAVAKSLALKNLAPRNLGLKNPGLKNLALKNLGLKSLASKNPARNNLGLKNLAPKRLVLTNPELNILAPKHLGLKNLALKNLGLNNPARNILVPTLAQNIRKHPVLNIQNILTRTTRKKKCLVSPILAIRAKLPLASLNPTFLMGPTTT
jgi:hypothetical protein